MLEGAIYVIPKPTFTKSNWLSGKYQDSAMTYNEQQMNLHPFLVRLRNQIGYSLFDEVKVSAVELGKDQNLFGGGHIEAYLGKDFVGENEISEKARKLKYVQDELKKRNVDLLFAIAPCKPKLMPEFISSKYDVTKKTRSNYDAYVYQFKKQNIHFIDFVDYFLKIKNSVKHPLATRCGVHWSLYGSTLAADTLIKYMEKLRNIDMPEYYSDGGEETTAPRGSDADIGKAMDLLRDIPSYTMYYPNIVFKEDSTKTKPNVLIVGDSYVESWLYSYEYIEHEFSPKTSFWYYNKQITWKPSNNDIDNDVSKLNLKEQTLNRDFILILFNEVNLNKGGYGFIEQMYDMLTKENRTK